MGNSNLFCNQYDSLGSSRLKQSVAIIFSNNVPRVKGKFDFKKQSTYEKIEGGALKFCQDSNLSEIYTPIIARLIAYNHFQFFYAFHRMSISKRQKLLSELQTINIEFLDSIYNHYIVEQKQKMNPYVRVSNCSFKPVPVIQVQGINRDHRITFKEEGLSLLKNGRVAIMLLCAGTSSRFGSQDKFMAPLPLENKPTILELLLLKLKKSIPQSCVKNIPLIFVVNQQNKYRVQKYLNKYNLFGFNPQKIKYLTISDLPVIFESGEMCIDFQYNFITKPEGSGKSIEEFFNRKLQKSLKKQGVQYIHIVGTQNIAESPGDPVMIGITKRLNKKIAAKCTDCLNQKQQFPRYVHNDEQFHLLNMQQVIFLKDNFLQSSTKVAMNSILIQIDELVKYDNNVLSSLYIQNRYHLNISQGNYFNFIENEPMINKKCYWYELDVRDYISISPETIFLNYQRSNHFMPLIYEEGDLYSIKEVCHLYMNPKSKKEKNESLGSTQVTVPFQRSFFKC